MPLPFIESPFPSKVEYEAYLALPERAQPATLRAAERGAYAPEALSAADHLPDYIRKAIYGEQSFEEKKAALADAQQGWRKMRFRQLSVEGTTRGEFITAGIISADDGVVNLPFGSPERAAAEAAQATR